MIFSCGSRQADWSDDCHEALSLSLRFSSPGREAGFLQANADKLRTSARMFFIIACTCEMITGCAMVYLAPSHINSQTPGYFAIIVQGCMMTICFLWSLLGIVCTGVPSILAFINLTAREIILSLTMCGLHVLISAGKEYYMGQMCGVEDPYWFWSQKHFSDSWVLVCHSLCVSFSHQLLPIRWCVLWPTQLSAAISYSVNVWILASPEQYPGLLWILFCIFLVSQSIGKRRSEKSERLLFSSLVSERTLRAEAEFRACNLRANASTEQSSSIGRNTLQAETDFRTCDLRTKSSDDQSGSTGRSSGPLFAGRLATIQELGHNEHWLIESRHLRLANTDPLGRGAFGIVCAGKLCGADVAMKIQKELVSNMKGTMNELRVLRHVRHQNIVTFYGACMNIELNDVVLVLERVYGEVLGTFVQEGGFGKSHPSDTRCEPADSQRCTVLTGICSALAYLHTRKPHGLVHADLKESNIIVECQQTGLRAKLLDFGLSRVLSSRAQPLGGTVRWMAPEVICKSFPSTAADVFSFGRLVFYIWTEQKPVKHMSEHTIKMLARFGLVPSLTWHGGHQTSAMMHIWKALSDECTRSCADERITMESVLARILVLPDEEGASAANSEERFWRAVAHMRDLRNVPSRKKEQLAPEVLGKRDLAPACVDPADVAPLRRVCAEHNLVYPDFQMTSYFAAVLPLILADLERVNFKPTKVFCCQFHSMVELLQAIINSICESSCLYQGRDFNAQCMECGILGGDESTDAHSCDVCGHQMRFRDKCGLLAL